MSEEKHTNTPTMIVSDPPAWQRALYMILFGVIGYAIILFVFFLAVVQFILVVINGQKNENLSQLASRINSYLKQILDFLSFAIDQVPFPFSPLPKNEPDGSSNDWEK